VPEPMFERVMVANRGEIACRVLRTCRALGIRGIAVASDADANALHARMADECIAIGPAPARDSYLRIEGIIEAARRSGAQAIHPGYGFLSENPAFAQACAEAGIAFVGPPASAMTAMALKGAAKIIAAEAGVPVVPGYEGDDQSDETMQAAAARIGFPVLLKPVAGGGGKGMRVVASEAEFAKAAEASRREALASCGDATLLVERYLASPRHVEVQIAADSHGSVIHLFDRDCSTQRRHQKVVEEAPAPGLPETTRRRMADAACALARRIGYVGVGTVEFLVDAAGDPGDPPFYFIEMNTRLQVEHPVTEMITGLDLVELQLRIAAGGTLGIAQNDVKRDGHAIEVRLCAEDPSKRFFPSPGPLSTLRFPPPSAAVRIDSGVEEGDAITPYYDSLIAKVIVSGSDRAEAIETLLGALDACEVGGIRSNLALLRAIVDSPQFRAGGVDTNFLEKALPQLLPQAVRAA
jgi:3-methylcrotonyl-CoA carboxylase alpha subunit